MPYTPKWIPHWPGSGGGGWFSTQPVNFPVTVKESAGWYHSYFIPGKDYLSGPWEMYWSVFLFPPAITWQRHLGGEWMSDAWSVSSRAVAPSVHWWVERRRAEGRDNAVINSVWTSCVCMRGSPSDPEVTGQWGICFFFGGLLFLSVAFVLVCSVSWLEAHMQNGPLWFLLTNACWESQQFNLLWISKVLQFDLGAILPQRSPSFCGLWVRCFCQYGDAVMINVFYIM